jgi:ribosomal protein L33
VQSSRVEARLFASMCARAHHACANTTLTLAPPPPQNRRNHPERLELKKYNPNLKRYTLHREIK